MPITWWAKFLIVWVTNSWSQSLAQARGWSFGISELQSPVSCVTVCLLITSPWLPLFSMLLIKIYQKNLTIASLSLVLDSSVSTVSFLRWSLYLFSFSGGCGFSEHLSEQQCCAASYYTLIYTSDLLALIPLTTSIAYHFSGGEVLHLHLIAMSSDFQDINGQNSACQQIRGICPAADVSLCWHLCLLLYFFVQNYRLFGPLQFENSEHAMSDSTRQSWSHSSSRGLEAKIWVVALQLGHNQCGNS